MAYENLSLEKKDNIAILTLNRPPANAVNLGLREDFSKALDEMENDKSVRVVIITGTGEKAFSAGFDVSDTENVLKGPDGAALWTRVDKFPKPVIAAINGFALGGGCELALACHFRIMSTAEKAKIGLTELNLGLIPGWGGTQRMTRLLGRKKALDLIMFAKRLIAQEALEIGLVDKICEPGNLMNDAMELARELAGKPPLAVRALLRAINAGQDKGFEEGLKVERQGVEEVFQSKDVQEGISAFLEKRKPEFKGE
jgi:enoyl-CoA hydratase/carnithine racemase